MYFTPINFLCFYNTPNKMGFSSKLHERIGRYKVDIVCFH